MLTRVSSAVPAERREGRGRRLRRRLWKERYIYLLLLPGLLYFMIYRYVPMAGIVIAFKDYSPFLGIADSPFIGMKHFHKIFGTPEVVQVLWNTLVISFLQIVFAFPAPILLALMLNEVRSRTYKRLIQSVVYLPHFLSWVVVVGIVFLFFRNEGLINDFLKHQFDMSSPIPFLTDPAYFRTFLVGEVIWKEIGWGTIIFLAALAGVNPSLHEAAIIDGANRWRQIWHITLPAIRSTIVILLILRLGHVLDTGFEQIFLQLNPFNTDVGNTLDTYVYYKGIQQSDYSFSTAVSLFKGIVGLVLVFGANRMARRFGEEGIF
jgi:putative aldouronate transport system permease protein